MHVLVYGRNWRIHYRYYASLGVEAQQLREKSRCCMAEPKIIGGFMMMTTTMMVVVVIVVVVMVIKTKG